MKSTFRLLCTAAMAVSTIACDKKDDATIETTSAGETNASASADSASARGNAMVRVVNAGAGGKDMALQLDGIAIFEGVKANSVTDYREVSANLARFAAHTPGATDTAALAQNDQVLMDGNRYTVFLISEDLSRSTLRIVQDEVIPDSGKARIRVIHAAPGGPELDVSIVGQEDKLFSGVNFKSEAGYKDVTPAKVALQIRAADGNKVLLSIPAMDLQRATATTIVLTGAAKLAYFTFTDAMTPAVPKM